MNSFDSRHQNNPYYSDIPPLPFLRRPIRKNANILCFGLLLTIFISIAIHFIWSFLVNLFSLYNILPPAFYECLDLLAYIASFAIPCILLVQFLGIPTRVAFPMRRVRTSLLVPSVLFCLGASVVGAILSSLVGALLYGVFGVTPVMPDLGSPEGPAATILYAISLTIAPAVMEEILFRGVIMQSLRRFGDSFALWTSAILFGLCHGNLVQGPNAILLGLVIGYIVLRSGSLVAGITMHFINNALALGIDMIIKQLGQEQGIMLNGLTLLVYIILGVVGLIWLLVTNANMFRVIPSRYPLPEAQKYASFFTSAAPIVYLGITVFFTLMYLE